jgi:hypothetical protein
MPEVAEGDYLYPATATDGSEECARMKSVEGVCCPDVEPGRSYRRGHDGNWLNERQS